jgi:hypothetical protein
LRFTAKDNQTLKIQRYCRPYLQPASYICNTTKENLIIGEFFGQQFKLKRINLTTGARSTLKSFFFPPAAGVLSAAIGESTSKASANGESGPALRSCKGLADAELLVLRPRPALAGAKLSSLSLVLSSSSTKLTVTLERVLQEETKRWSANSHQLKIILVKHPDISNRGKQSNCNYE